MTCQQRANKENKKDSSSTWQQKKAWLRHEKSAWLGRWIQNEGDKAMHWKQNIKDIKKKLMPSDKK